MKKILTICTIFSLISSTVVFGHFDLDLCINTLDKAYRTHYNIINSTKDDKHPLEHDNLIDSFLYIENGCNKKFYKMSVVAFGHVFFGNEIDKSNSLQMCLFDIYSAYSMFAFNEERLAIVKNENGGDVQKDLITQFEKSNHCAYEVKKKVLKKLGVSSH